MFWDELDEDQIYVEILKRFPDLKDETGGSMYKVFGEEWGLLQKRARESAELRFRNGIRDKTIKGIIYDHLGKGELRRDEHDDVVYKRIPNDVYRK